MPARVPVPGSERQLDPTHVRVGDVDSDATAQVTVYLAHRTAPNWVDEAALTAPGSRRRLTRQEWVEAHGADPEHIVMVLEFARRHGLAVENADAGRRAVTLSGSVHAFTRAFEPEFAGLYASADGQPGYRARSGMLTIPEEMQAAVVGVFGLDDRPQATPKIRFAQAASTTYTPIQVAQAYGFPSGVDGTGETVGIIELGGGFATSDLTAYFEGLGLTTPSVTAVPVDGASNNPGADKDADGEVMLDIEVIGAIAHGAKIAVYFAPNTDQGFIDAVSQAVHDTANTPSVVSISWGGSEDSWTDQARNQMEQILSDAGAMGVTVTVAAGDGGSADGATDGKQHVDFPASAPHALGCGGTHLNAIGSEISSETVWDTSSTEATGGGVSDAFALPSYQSSVTVPHNVDTDKPGRGVPDVAGDADPDTGYSIRVDGVVETIGGTSAVAPLWAALIALLNQSLGAPLGFAHPRLYALAGTAAFHDITSGSNGRYAAGPGWDACTGLGSPAGVALTQQLGTATS
jgi:kumamolisin